MKKSLFEQTISDLEKYTKLIKESYVFDDETSSYNDEDMMDEYPEEETEENMGNMQSDDKINQIRMLALDGIQDYADDVDSEEYDFFKKIWLMCDKVCSSKESAKDME